jgi:hypothetical protein
MFFSFHNKFLTYVSAIMRCVLLFGVTLLEASMLLLCMSSNLQLLLFSQDSMCLSFKVNTFLLLRITKKKLKASISLHSLLYLLYYVFVFLAKQNLWYFSVKPGQPNLSFIAASLWYLYPCILRCWHTNIITSFFLYWLTWNFNPR